MALLFSPIQLRKAAQRTVCLFCMLLIGCQGGQSSHRSDNVNAHQETGQESVANESGLGGLPPQNQTELPVLNYPNDFPSNIDSLYLGGAVRVVGLQPLTSYTFSTGPAHTISAQNLFEETGSIICFDDHRCTGTVVNGEVAVIVIGATTAGGINNTSEFSLDIKPSNAPPVYYEGSSSTPVPVTTGTQLGRVGASQLENDNSYYELQNLTTGSRYSVQLRSLDNANLKSTLAVSATDHSPLCDPNQSGDNLCQFVAQNSTANMVVDGSFAIFGEIFNIELTELSLAKDFEGSWLQPAVVSMHNPDLTQHLGHTDEFLSYYDIAGFQDGSRYTITLHSQIKLSTLYTVDLHTASLIGGICKFINTWDNTGEHCTFVASGDKQKIAVKGSLSTPTARYIIRIQREAASQGSLSEPQKIYFNEVSQGAVAVTASHYLLQDLPIDTPVILTARSISGKQPQLSLKTDGELVPCYPSSCEFISADGSATLAAHPDPNAIKSSKLLLAAMPLPQNETASLSYGDAPFTVQVGHFFSNYKVSGLQASSDYLIELSSPSNPVSLSVLGDSVLQCRTNTGVSPSGCVATSDSNGNLDLRVGGTSLGAWATLNIRARSFDTAQFSSQDTPLHIAENEPTGATSTIVVSGSDVSSISRIAVNVNVQHEFTSDISLVLIAPDGRQIDLSDHLSGSSLIDVTFDDFAETKIAENGLRYRNNLRPQTPLHPLNDLPANGLWQLQVVDDRSSNISTAMGGELLGWGISFFSD